MVVGWMSLKNYMTCVEDRIDVLNDFSGQLVDLMKDDVLLQHAVFHTMFLSYK